MSRFSLTYNNDELNLLSVSLFGVRHATAPFPAGLVKSGKINDIPLFCQILKQALTKAGITAHSIVIGLPEREAFIKILRLPKTLHNAEILQAIQYQWQDLFPISPDAVYFDFLVLDKGKKADTHQNVLFVAYPKEAVDIMITACNQLGLVPETLISASFGLSALLSRKGDSGATLIIKSGSGQDITAIISYRGHTLFSTVVHTPVNNPAAVKQLDSVRGFFEKTISQGAIKINRIILLPGTYAEMLSKQLAGLSLPISIAATNSIIRGGRFTDLNDMGRFLYNYGLLKQLSHITIVPIKLASQIEQRNQLSLIRSSSLAALSALVIASYISLTFMNTLKTDQRVSSSYSNSIVERVSQDNIKTTQEIEGLNKQIDLLSQISEQRIETGSTLEILSSAAKSAGSGVKVTEISLDNGQKSVMGTVELTDKTHFAAFVDSVKSNPQFTQKNITVNPANWQDPSITKLNFTISPPAQ